MIRLLRSRITKYVKRRSLNHVLGLIIKGLAFSLLLSGCQSLIEITPKDSSSTSTKEGGILIVNSNSQVERYRIAEQAFRDSLPSEEIVTADLYNERHPIRALQQRLNDRKFDKIYCIGAKALGSIDQIITQQDIVFSSVLRWQSFQHKPEIKGVASDVAPSSQLTMFKHFFPQIHSIGVLYSESNKALVQQLRDAANELNLNIVAIKLNNTRHINEQLAILAQQSEALLVLPDPVILASTQHAKHLMASAAALSLPVFSTNRVFNELGATFTISADLPTTGRQAAMLIQQDTNSETQRIYHPVGSHISLNLNKVEKYKLELNYQALDSVNELIE